MEGEGAAAVGGDADHDNDNGSGRSDHTGRVSQFTVRILTPSSPERRRLRVESSVRSEEEEAAVGICHRRSDKRGAGTIVNGSGIVI